MSITCSALLAAKPSHLPPLEESSNANIQPENILTPQELAARLRVRTSWITEKTRARCVNPIPCFRIGRYVRFDWSRVIQWLALTEKRTTDAKRPTVQKKR